jgi:hypothetical protein
MSDFSDHLVDPLYVGPAPAPGDWFYVWFNLDSGAIEMFFATDSTASTPAQTGRLIYQMFWYQTNYAGGQTEYTTIVNGSGDANATAQTDSSAFPVFGDGTNGLSAGYFGTVQVVSYTSNVTESDPGNVESAWNQYKGVSEANGNTTTSEDHLGTTTVTTTLLGPGANQTWHLDLSDIATGRYNVSMDTPWSTGLYRVTLQNVGFLFEQATPVCFHRDSLVTIQRPILNETENKLAKDVVKGDMVFSTTQNKFVPVIANIITHNNTLYRLLKKDALGENKPNQDFYITGGHHIMYKGEEKIMNDVPEAETIEVKGEEVYSIATDIREYILVNGIEVATWGYDYWLKFAKKHDKIWGSQ